MQKSLPIGEKIGVLLGNFFEHYDTALYGFLAPVLATIFFPNLKNLEALILTYAAIPIGMLARPIGAVFFGFLSDTKGRRSALYYSLIGMSFISIFIAFIPTQLRLHFLTPLLFSLARILQNFFASAEVSMGGVFLVENVDSKKKDIISSLFAMSTIGGILLASFSVYFISKHFQIEKWWRVLYLLGALTGSFGLLLRRKNEGYTKKREPLNFIYLIKSNFRNVAFIAIVSGFSYATFSVSMFLLSSFFPLVTSVSQLEMIELNGYLLMLDFIALPLFGYLTMKIGRERSMLIASILIIIIAISTSFLDRISLLGIVWIRAIFVLLGAFFFAPFHAWSNQLICRENRCQLIGFSYAIGSQILGSPTISLSLFIFKKTSIVMSVFWYWIFLSLLSIWAVLASKKIKGAVRTQPLCA
jgi:MFS family permease